MRRDEGKERRRMRRREECGYQRAVDNGKREREGEEEPGEEAKKGKKEKRSMKSGFLIQLQFFFSTITRTFISYFN